MQSGVARPEFFSEKALFPTIGVLLALSALFGLLILPRLAPPGGALVDKPAPDFTLPVVHNGEPNARLRLSELHDKLVLLDFWASWCGPCEMQAPILDRLARKYPDLVVLGVNVGEPPEVVRRYASSKGLSYPMLADVDGQAQSLYGAASLPTLVVVDKRGKVTTVLQGLVRQPELERVIREHL
jgi:thiol-disulfide isomerase/thioredoxin